MYYCYIIFSVSKNKYYIGSTSNLEERIKKHNTNHKGFTGGKGDWVIKWFQQHPSKELATIQERQIKSWKSRIAIEKLIQQL